MKSKPTFELRILAGLRFEKPKVVAKFYKLQTEEHAIRLIEAILASRPNDGSWQMVRIEFRRPGEEFRQIGPKTKAKLHLLK